MALIPMLAKAGLGQTEAAIERDRTQLHSSARQWSMGPYRVHELLTPEGDRIREFVGADGLVFAVAWEGPFMPSLQVLLGTQLERARTAARVPGDHSQLHIQQPGLVLHSVGHLRAFQGQAYLPEQVPAGVDVRELR